ncbi:YihY/virulence factor BrkB family protein [Primorskyibacter sp. S87]|uniref:YihY/virulence factor BrkB family protein n=1 Tax=Primorskyibacter sp. S87 TaxID=3415126 RepID=UPI003C7D02C7
MFDPLLPVRAFGLAAQRFNTKGGWIMSSHVAMSMMLALFPFILFVVALAGSLSQGMLTQDMIDLVFGAWPKEVSEPILAELESVLANSSTRLMTFGGVLALYFSSNGVDAVREAMTRAYHDEDNRPFWKTRLLCLAVVIVSGAILIVTATVEVVLPVYTSLVSDTVPSKAWSWFSGERLAWIFAFVIPVAAIFSCHAILPARRHSMRQLLPGVLLTFALWLLAGWGFSIYLSRFASYSATYAGLAGAMAALIFLYLNAAILIFGAEYNGALMDLTEEGGKDPDEDPGEAQDKHRGDPSELL